MADPGTDAMVEIEAMKAVAEALAGLDAEVTGRVVRWAAERYGIALTAARLGAGRVAAAPTGASQNLGDEQHEVRAFADLAELFNAAGPDTEAERALVGGYWFQFSQGAPDFKGQAINAALKDMGHGVSNITSAFDSLKAQRPALVMQVKKAGSTKQARKKYKLTTEGKKAVELMLTERT